MEGNYLRALSFSTLFLLVFGLSYLNSALELLFLQVLISAKCQEIPGDDAIYKARRWHRARFYLVSPAFQPLLPLPSSRMKSWGRVL